MAEFALPFSRVRPSDLASDGRIRAFSRLQGWIARSRSLSSFNGRSVAPILSDRQLDEAETVLTALRYNHVHRLDDTCITTHGLLTANNFSEFLAVFGVDNPVRSYKPSGFRKQYYDPKHLSLIHI